MTRIILISITAAMTVPVVAQPTAGLDDYHARLRRVQTDTGVAGASGCANCHSGDKLKTGDEFTGKAYDLWRGKNGDGPHYAAFKSLDSEQSKTMARLLAAIDGLAPDPTKRDDCLSCHAFGHDISETRRLPSFQLEDGVSCEACHGGSAAWQFDHQFKGWHGKSAQEWLEKGMYETRDLRRWSEKCLECHLGTDEKRVTHTMMGAGHPALTLELVADAFNVPKHWDWKRTYLSEDEGAWYFARLWAVGQAVTLRENMKQLTTWAETPQTPPDFALFDCYACHHEHLKTASRNPVTTVADSEGGVRRAAKLGQPTWNASSWIVSRHLVDVLAPEDRDAFSRDIATIFESLRIQRPQPAVVATAARRVGGIADRLAKRVVGVRFNRAMVRKMLRAMVGDPQSIIDAGPFAADQLFGALNALYYLAWSDSEDKPANDAAIIAAMNRLKALIYDDDGSLSLTRFEPAAVRKVMAELAEELGKTN